MKTITISYEGYLIESKLIDLFRQLSEQLDFKYNTNVSILSVCTTNKKVYYRGDLVVYGNNYDYLIEFDGYQHYSQTSVMVRDTYKEVSWNMLNEKRNKIQFSLPRHVAIVREVCSSR